jgi:hypothetical protein
MKAFRLLALVFAVVISAVPLMYSQTSEGRILGTVFDQSGAVIAGAKVTVPNTATSVSRQLVTTSAANMWHRIWFPDATWLRVKQGDSRRC